MSQLPEPSYRYGEIKQALTRIHGFEETSGIIDARIRNFQRIGIVPSSPGKGQKLGYKLEHAAKWAFSLEITKLGLPPSVVKLIIDTCWVDAYPHIAVHARPLTKRSVALLVLEISVWGCVNDAVTYKIVNSVEGHNRSAVIIDLSDIGRSLLCALN